MKTLKKLQCLHIDEAKFLAPGMNDVIVVTIMMCFICVQFHIFQLVTIRTTTVTQFAYACLVHLTYRVLIHVTPQHRYFQLNY